MPRIRALVPVVAAACSIIVAPGAAQAVSTPDRPFVQQVGTYDRLVQPDFSAIAPLAAAIDGQTLGLGTFDNLDGEFVLVGGTPYRVGIDGRPTVVDPERTTPWVQAVDFRPEASSPVPPGTTCAQLPSLITQTAGTSTDVVAVRVRGTFADLVMRSVPPQARPYPALTTVVANQSVFPLGEERAVLVGFHQGDRLLGVGQPGLHLHGVTADRSAGGHVLSCVAGSNVQLSVQRTAGVVVHAD